MAIPIGEVGLSGFRLVAKRPVSALVWSVVGVVSLIAAAVGAVFAAAGGDMASISRATPDAGFIVRLYLVMVPVLLLGASVIYCAVYRAVLRPEERGFAYLRLGGDELRMLGLFFILGVIGTLALLGLTLALIMMQFVLGTVAGAVAGELGGGLVGLLGLVIFVGATSWLAVRISFAGPMTFAKRRIQLGAAWEMTEGKFWPLFGAYLIAWVLSFGMFLVVAIVNNALTGAISGAEAGAASPAQAMAAGIVIIVLQLAVVGPAYAVTGAPAAEAYARFAPRRNVADTFA